MNSTEQQGPRRAGPARKVIKAIQNRNKLEEASALMALDELDQQAAERLRMTKAENRAAAKSIGWPIDDEGEEDAMRQTVLGDLTTEIHHHQPPAPETAKRGLGKLAALALPLAGLALGGPLGFAIAKALTPVAEKAIERPAAEDQTTFLRLGEPGGP